VKNLLPVIDLLDGHVVHAVRGNRQDYRPVRSVLCETANADDVAFAFVSKLHVSEVYVADLNAIQARPVQWEPLIAIDRAGLRIWLDAGMTSIRDVQATSHQLLQLGIRDTLLVIGLETWRDPNELETLLKTFGADRLVFSLDLRGGIPLVSSDQWPPAVMSIVRRVCNAGFQRLLLLDLAQVGTGEGPSTIGFCQSIKAHWPHLQLACGGGVRNAADYQALIDAGCDVVLVATALHLGTLNLS